MHSHEMQIDMSEKPGFTSSVSLRLLEQVDAERLGLTIAGIVGKLSRRARRSTRDHENHVLPLHVADDSGRRKGNGTSGATTEPRVGGTEWRIIRADEHRSIWKQAIICRIFGSKINHYVTIFRAARPGRIVDAACARGGQELSAVKAIRRRESWNRPSPLPVVGDEGGLQRGTCLRCRGMVSERGCQDGNVIGLGNGIERRKDETVVLGADN